MTKTNNKDLQGVRLFDDRVMIQQDEAESKSKGGIILADIAKESPQRGTVVLVGPGRQTLVENKFVNIPIDLKCGDRVLFQKYSGIEFTPDENAENPTKYLIMTKKDIILRLPS